MKFNNKIKNHMNTDVLYNKITERLADLIFKMSEVKTDIAIVKSESENKNTRLK